MDWLPDGRLVISHLGRQRPVRHVQAGEVYILGNHRRRPRPGKVTTKRIASGLKEPMGLKVVDGVVYVSREARG